MANSFFEKWQPNENRKIKDYAITVFNGVMELKIKSLLLALFNHILCTNVMGGKGPSCFYTTLTGIMVGKQRYLVAVPGVAVNLSDYDLPLQSQTAHGLSFLVGFVAAYNKLI